MRYGVDMTAPPTVAQATEMAALGYSVCNVYIGGPRAAAHNLWHQVDGHRYPVGQLAAIFADGFLPTFVGRNVPWDQGSDFTFTQGIADGTAANVATGACGFDGDSPMVLDVEAGSFEPMPAAVLAYIIAFRYTANRAGHALYVYGDRALIGFLAGANNGLVDGLWLAAPEFEGRDGMAAPVGSFDPAAPPPPICDGWQFGGGTVAGVSVDYNAFSDSLVTARYAGVMP